MASPNHAWWEGMYLVGRNFYGRFLPEARTLAGDQAAEVVEAHLQGEGHQWLADPNQGSTILGFALGGAEAGTETAGPGESAAAPEAE
jgi:hydroxylamine dehydrogenase